MHLLILVHSHLNITMQPPIAVYQPIAPFPQMGYLNPGNTTTIALTISILHNPLSQLRDPRETAYKKVPQSPRTIIRPHIFVLQQWKQPDPINRLPRGLKKKTASSLVNVNDKQRHAHHVLYAERKSIVVAVEKLGIVHFEAMFKGYLEPGMYKKLALQIKNSNINAADQQPAITQMFESTARE